MKSDVPQTRQTTTIPTVWEKPMQCKQSLGRTINANIVRKVQYPNLWICFQHIDVASQPSHILASLDDVNLKVGGTVTQSVWETSVFLHYHFHTRQCCGRGEDGSLLLRRDRCSRCSAVPPYLGFLRRMKTERGFVWRDGGVLAAIRSFNVFWLFNASDGSSCFKGKSSEVNGW